MYLAHGMTTPDGKQLSDANYTAHPSNLVIPGEIEKVKQPLSIAIGDKDFVLDLQSLKKAEAILDGLKDVKTEVVVYPGCGHGFAVRADTVDNPKAAEHADKAEDQMVRFITEAFKEAGYKL